MQHTDLILIAGWGTFLQLVKCARFPRQRSVSSSQRWWRWAHTWMWDAGEHVSVPATAASITVLVFTWWETLLGSSSPFSSERMDVWLWSHQLWTSEAAEKHPSSWVLRVPLIGDHVFVPDRLWNGVLLHGCVTPASHQGDWLVWSCGMFPSGPQ